MNVQHVNCCSIVMATSNHRIALVCLQTVAKSHPTSTNPVKRLQLCRPVIGFLLCGAAIVLLSYTAEMYVIQES
jgi:hypothetical protein